MLSPSYLLAVIFISIQGSCGQIVMTQTPDSISVSPGQTITITCTSSSGTGNNIAWYQQKSGKSPTLLIYNAATRHTGVPDRFTGSSGGNPYTRYSLTITDVTEDDVGKYYCMQRSSFPRTFGGGTTVEIKRRENAKPSVFIFRPSVEQITSGSASSVCFVDQFYPGDAKVTWKADNKVITSGVETSDKIKDKDSTYSLSSTLTMPSAEFKKYETFTCEVTHVTLTPALATSFKASECTF